MSVPYENGQAHARRALDEAFERQNMSTKGRPCIDESTSFCRNPDEYDWIYIGKREMLVPYNCDPRYFDELSGSAPLNYPKPGFIRWEAHPVWIVEGFLHRGESNVLTSRRFYIDATTKLILLGEGYDRAGTLVNCFMLHTNAGAGVCSTGRWYSV